MTLIPERTLRQELEHGDLLFLKYAVILIQQFSNRSENA